ANGFLGAERGGPSEDRDPVASDLHDCVDEIPLLFPHQGRALACCAASGDAAHASLDQLFGHAGGLVEVDGVDGLPTLCALLAGGGDHRGDASDVACREHDFASHLGLPPFYRWVRLSSVVCAGIDGSSWRCFP